MSDLISKQDAIKVVNAVWEITGDKNVAKVWDQIKDLPSAQPERQIGRWIRNDNGTYTCSVCHSWIPEEQYYYARYCLYCGAKMKGEHDETN